MKKEVLREYQGEWPPASVTPEGKDREKKLEDLGLTWLKDRGAVLIMHRSFDAEGVPKKPREEDVQWAQQVLPAVIALPTQPPAGSRLTPDGIMNVLGDCDITTYLDSMDGQSPGMSVIKLQHLPAEDALRLFAPMRDRVLESNMFTSGGSRYLMPGIAKDALELANSPATHIALNTVTALASPRVEVAS